MKQPTNDPGSNVRRKPAKSRGPARAREPRDVDVNELLAVERQAREQAEATASAKDEFLAVVTHELRSPLNAIRGWAHVLRHSGALQPLQLKALDAIDRNTQAQVQLVDDLLDSQRILCGKLELVPARVPLQTIVDEAVEAVQPAAQNKRIRLETASVTSAMVKVDPDRLRQALVKLLSNAVKFTPEDGIVCVRTTLANEQIHIAVRDTGVGLDASQLPGVFDRFKQADSSNSRRANGLGLGLSLARQLVELHEGTIQVESEGAGQGSTFTIVLPQSILQDAAPLAPTHEPQVSPLAGKRVVIVEDDDDGREVLGLILRGANVELHSFDRASKAYEYLAHTTRSEQPDVLISDIAMPDEDGYEFIQRVRKLEGRQHRPHVVALALTSFARLEDRVRALKAGFDEHVAKPIDPERVLKTLVDVLGRDEAPAVQA